MRSLPASLNIDDPLSDMVDCAQVSATPSALALLDRIKAEHGKVSIHHQGGYANGSDAMCLPFKELRIGKGDILLGVVQGTPVFVFGRGARDWDERQFVLDAIESTCGAFSLDSGTGWRFFVRSREYAMS